MRASALTCFHIYCVQLEIDGFTTGHENLAIEGAYDTMKITHNIIVNDLLKQLMSEALTLCR